MNYSRSTKLLLFLSFIAILSCNKIKKDSIHHKIVGEEYVVITDVASLQTSDDPISNHIDSILSGQINTTIISTGQLGLDLNGNENTDLYFEIVDLNPYNPNGLPTGFDSLALTAGSSTVEFLDNSTWGYADALIGDQIIDENHHWDSDVDPIWNDIHVCLGTFLNAGQFNGKGNKYLGFRIPNGNDYNYGWIKLYCSAHNDTLKLLEFAYNETINKSIEAGQTN